MNNINKLYAESAKIIKEMDLPYEDIANLAKIGQKYTNDFPEVASLPSGFDGIRETVNDILKQLPIDSILNAQKTIQVDLKPVLESVQKLVDLIPFEQIPAIVEVLQEVDLNEANDEGIVWTEEKSEEILKDLKFKIEEVIQATGSNIKEMWQGIILILRKQLPKEIFLSFIIMMIMSPYTYITEDLQTYIHEKWEDSIGVDMTGEIVMMIREDVYLRAESSEYALIVLETPLKKAQSVLRLGRDGDWVQISVLIDGETHTGWVEKSKLAE